MRGFSDSFQKTLLGEARTIMAADLSARMFRQPTQQEEQQLNVLASHGIQRTEVTDTVSMVSSPGDPVPLLVSLKAVDPQQYPFYGTVDLQPAGDLRQVLTDATVVVAEDLLIRLHTQVGASLKIGDSTFRIAAILVREPDRMSSGMGSGSARDDDPERARKERPAAAGQPLRRALPLQAVSVIAAVSPPCAPAWSRCCPMRRSPTSGKAIPR